MDSLLESKMRLLGRYVIEIGRGYMISGRNIREGGSDYFGHKYYMVQDKRDDLELWDYNLKLLGKFKTIHIYNCECLWKKYYLIGDEGYGKRTELVFISENLKFRFGDIFKVQGIDVKDKLKVSDINPYYCRDVDTLYGMLSVRVHEYSDSKNIYSYDVLSGFMTDGDRVVFSKKPNLVGVLIRNGKKKFVVEFDEKVCEIESISDLLDDKRKVYFGYGSEKDIAIGELKKRAELVVCDQAALNKILS